MVEVRKHPSNTEDHKHTVLISGSDFSNLTGMPKYHYVLARELTTMHYDVIITAPRVGGMLKDRAEAEGIAVVPHDQIQAGMHIDFMLLAEPESAFLLGMFPHVPALNYLHSKNDCDRPITKTHNLIGYLSPRREVQQHWLDTSRIDSDIIPIPIDPEEFNKQENQRFHDRYVILAPCTLDPLRKDMLLDLIERAKKDSHILLRIFGKNYGALDGVTIPDNVEIHDASDTIADEMRDCDEVAGIYVGTVTLEAWFMGKVCSVYDDSGHYTLMDAPDNISEHRAEVVAHKFDSLLKKPIADIIIPHHDRADLLAECLQSIPMPKYNVIIRRNGTFSFNCNEAAKLATTDWLIFVNDDMRVSGEVLMRMISCNADIVGIGQQYPDGTPLALGITFVDNHYKLTDSRDDVMYPSGGCFAIKRKVWEDLGGFSEAYKNGGEDQDLFLRALEKGYKITFAEGHVIHHLSQSAGRFNDYKENDKIFHKTWTPDRIAALKKRI